KMGIPELDHVAELFGISEKAAPPPPLPSVPIRSTLTSVASEIVGRAPDTLRLLWRPGREIIRSEDPQEFLVQIRRPWIRFRLAQYAHPTPRQDGLIKDLMRPQQLGQKERDGLLQLFSLDLIDSVVRQNAKHEQLIFSMLEELSQLDLPDYVQASIWAAMISS